MSQFYLNGPSVGRAISAEEFARAAGRLPDQSFAHGANDGPGAAGRLPDRSFAHGANDGCQIPAPSGCDCGCGGSNSNCPSDGCGQDAETCQPMICCCRPAPEPTPQPPEVDEGCCCKQSFRAALGLLCSQQISNLLDFDSVAFLTDTYAAGAALTSGKSSAVGRPKHQAEGDAAETSGRPKPPTPTNPNGPSDNLEDLTGSFRRFAACTCDLLDIDAELYTAEGKSCGFTASQLSLCQLDALVIQGAAATEEGDLTADQVEARNFRCLRQQLAQRLNPCGSPCGESCCSCASDGRDCCCAAGLLATLAQNNLSRRVSLAAGLLVLRNVTLLGAVGNVLVLSNDTDNRLYFVCVNSVQFIG